MKALIEKRNTLITELEKLLETAEKEERALTEEEMNTFNTSKTEISNLDNTIKSQEELRALEKKKTVENKDDVTPEVRAMANYIRGKCGVEIRAGEQNLDMGNNGAIIPVTIAQRIINKVKEMCPILAKATIFNVKGTLKIPVWGLANDSHDIAVGYQEEFTDITADSGKFTSVDLSGFLAGALTLIGKSVITNGDVDVVNFIVAEMARKISLFIEKELLNGTADKATGAIATTTTLNAGSTSAISADSLIELQSKIPTAYQGAACWIMNPATFLTLKKLKDGNGQYLLQNDFSQSFPYAILGKPVYLSDNMPVIASAAKAVLYGDFSGLAVNFRENISIQILNEKYATQHAIGVVSWFDFDSKVMDNQKIAALVMSA